MGAYLNVLHALGDATRRDILEALVRKPQAVGELAAKLPVSRPAVSQHLKVLKDGGLVRETRQGTRRVYSVEIAGIVELRRYLDAFWSRALASFESAAAAAPSARSGAGRARKRAKR